MQEGSNAVRGTIPLCMEATKASSSIEKDTSLPDDIRHLLSKLMAKNGPVIKLHEELKHLLPNTQGSQQMGKISKLMWPFKEKKAAEIAERLRSFYRDITTILAIDSRNMLKEVDRVVKEVSRGVQEIKEAEGARRKDEERRRLFDRMNPVSCVEKHDASCRQRNPETGRWIFHTDQYVAWKKSDRTFLWLNGLPGSGKTILASAVIDDIMGSGEAEPQTLCYFYCNFRDDRTTNAAAVLRSLIVQLLQQSKVDWIPMIGEQQESNTKGAFDCLRNLGQQNHEEKPHPTDLEFLRRLLVEASTLVRRPVLVIDALDECQDYSDLVKHLVDLAEDAHLRLFVTGRNEPDIQDAFRDLPTLSLKDSAEQMKADIHVHIMGQLKNQKRLSRLPDVLKKMVLEKLLEKAEGMFRWVQCQLDVIMKCKRPDSIRKALDDLPTGLYETYDRIMYSINERGQDDVQIAQRCLLLLAGTFTPLTLDQLNEAMMIEVGQASLNENLGVTDTMDIIVACGSLVTYNEETGIITLSHYSVKEYLINRPNKIFKSISDMHARICELLITYVLCDFVDEICAKGMHPALHQYFQANVSKDNPLLSYAILAWKHLEHISDEDPDVMTALSRLNLEFLRNTEKHRMLATRQEGGLGQPDTNRWLSANVTVPSLLFIPLEHGKPWMVEYVVKHHPHLLNTDIAPGWGSPLIFAIAKRPDCLSIFLKPGVYLNKLSFIKSRFYGRFIQGNSHTPISWAAANGNEVAVDFLLSQTDVDMPNDILHMAIRGDSHECIRKFRRHGADANFTVNSYTPIHSFLSHVSRDGPQLDSTARTALHIALDHRMEDIIPYLLEQEAGLSATATLHPVMWSWATNKSWFPKVRLAAHAADQPCIRINGKVVGATENFQTVKFSIAVTPAYKNPNPICTIIISAVLESKVSFPTFLGADLSYCNQSLQDFPKDDLCGFKFSFEWEGEQCVCSRLFDHHQGDEVTRMLQQLDKNKDPTGTSLLLRMFKASWSNDAFEHGITWILDVYRGPLS
ncbi:hypothetical protein BDR04DRAFT_823975 [Suillus decipiens]|nr:hypothetical protein BDR04DRAFT_823975 [Suillus decipiens]